MRFRLLTYNIHKGIGGVDRKYRPERIAEAIHHYSPDVALLQEVDEHAPRSLRHAQAQMLAEMLDMPYRAYQRNVRLKVGHYGNAILSRFPLHDVHDFDLTMPPKKRRQGLIARCRVTFNGHSRTLVVANVHLGLAGYERRLQLRRLLNGDSLSHIAAKTPLVVAGDYNDFYGSLDRVVMRNAGFELAGKKVRTFPAALPLRPLDRVFYRGDLTALRAFAGRVAVARAASDHLPLVTDFELTS